MVHNHEDDQTDHNSPGEEQTKGNEVNHDHDEPPLEDFLFTEEDTIASENRKKKKAVVGRIVSFFIVVGLVLSGLGVWVKIFNLPSFEFLEKSNELSQIENIQDYKEAVVTIQGTNSKGTGFNISPDGTIITNYHVIEHIPTIAVVFPNGEIYSAEVIEQDPELDIALLDIDAESLPHLDLQEDNSWSEGNHIYVIGNPLAYSQVVMEGEISTSDATMRITAPIHKGNSGSPVIDEQGKVIGVVYAKTIPEIGSGKESLGLAVPIEEVFHLLN